jgi:hypothetical protein
LTADDLEAPSPGLFLSSGKPSDASFNSDRAGILPFASAPAFALAGVLTLAAIIAGLAATLALTIVLALAAVLALFRIGHSLQSDPGFGTTGARGICTYRE